VPAGAIFREGQRAFCYKWDGRRAEKVEVKTGPSDSVSVIVEKGLKKGDRICLSRPSDSLVAVGGSR